MLFKIFLKLQNWDEFRGMQPVLQLSGGARVMLLLKLWAEVGLCNKAMGEVKRLICKENAILSS